MTLEMNIWLINGYHWLFLVKISENVAECDFVPSVNPLTIDKVWSGGGICELIMMDLLLDVKNIMVIPTILLRPLALHLVPDNNHGQVKLSTLIFHCTWCYKVCYFMRRCINFLSGDDQI